MKNDVQIQKEVVAELDREQDVVAGTVGVEVHHGVVKLAGRVGEEAVKGNSELAARRVEGVTDVVMDIDVAGDRTAPLAAGGGATGAP